MPVAKAALVVKAALVSPPPSTKAKVPVASFVSIDVDGKNVNRVVPNGDWDTLLKPLSHLTTEVVDSYLEMLKESPNAPKNVVLLNSMYWSVLISQVDDATFRSKMARFKGRDGKRFEGKRRILWAVHGFAHFAVLDISLENRNIRVFDSVKEIAPKWVTPRLQQLLCSIVGAKDDFQVLLPKCCQQVNSDDCGVYAMANLRSLLFQRKMDNKSMVGEHLGHRRAEAVKKLRKKFFDEFKERRLSEWW